MPALLTVPATQLRPKLLERPVTIILLLFQAQPYLNLLRFGQDWSLSGLSAYNVRGLRAEIGTLSFFLLASEYPRSQQHSNRVRLSLLLFHSNRTKGRADWQLSDSNWCELALF